MSILSPLKNRYLIFYQLEEIGDNAPRNPGIHVPPSAPMPEIPPPPSRPPPPIPQTSFVSKEKNQQPPSPMQTITEYDLPESQPPSYQYSEPSSAKFASPTTQSPTTPLQQYQALPVNLSPPSPTRPPPPLPISESGYPPSRPTQPHPPPPSIYTSPPPPPTQPPPPPPDFLDMPANPPIAHQTWSQRPTSPPMPSHHPPLPPQVSPVHATGSNGSTYSYSMAEHLDMPEVPVPPGQEDTRYFIMDDDEDLYGEQADDDGKHAEREQKNDNCVVQ